MAKDHVQNSDTSGLEGRMPLALVLEALDFLILEPTPDGRFRVQGIAPEWTVQFYGDDVNLAVSASPFLSHFVETIASPLWEGPPAAPASSGVWSEEMPSTGSVEHFEAHAIRAKDGGDLLAIRRMGGDFEQLQMLAQRANENALEHQQLQREMQKKDVLLKCIVHDLNNPLSAVLLNLQLLAATSDEKVKASAELALESARRQRNLIKSITEVFSSDLSRLESHQECSEPVSVIVAAAEQIIKTHQNDAMRRHVSISFEDGLSAVAPSGVVHADAGPFLRVLENLLLNALRYAPRDSTISVCLSVDDDGIVVEVDDAGSGVEPELIDALFDPFTQGATNRGSMGLGLYFCRMTVEAWNGTINYESIDGGGARFVMSIPWASAGDLVENGG